MDFNYVRRFYAYVSTFDHSEYITFNMKVINHLQMYYFQVIQKIGYLIQKTTW